MSYIIRKARVEDVRQIYGLLGEMAARGILLSRSLSDLYDQVRDFTVAASSQDPARLAGMCGLHVSWEDLGEIRSLAVRPEDQGLGLGRRLVAACLEEAGALGVTRVFVLTYIPEFFTRQFAFEPIDKGQLPHKVWADCLHCVKFPDCGETALSRRL